MAQGEFQMIDRLLKPLAAGCPGALGLTDDAALLAQRPGTELVIAKDAIVEGVHFRPEDPPGTVAQKLLRQNLSDLAAMGAEPVGYLTAFGLRRDLPDGWLDGFVAGLADDQRQFGIHLLGGDTVSTPGPLFFSLTVLGCLPAGTALTRAGARPGDLVCVSGTLGDGALGLAVLEGRISVPADAAAYLADRYRVPQPRLVLGQALRGLASACLDVSDGLLGDLGHILATSGPDGNLGAVIRAGELPLSPAAAGLPGALEAALTGGDDYELLFTVPPRHRARLTGLPVPVAVIGEIRSGAGTEVLGLDGAPLSLSGQSWTHF